MDRFMTGVLIFIMLLWLPLCIAAIYGWFTPIGLGYKIGFTVSVCAIWIPVIGAWIDMNSY